MKLLRLIFFLARVTGWRHAVLDWKHAATVVAILALGVASFLSIRMANRAAVVSFTGFTESVSGGSDLTLTSPAGYLDGKLLAEIRATLGTLPVELIPILTGHATIPLDRESGTRFGQTQGSFTVLGVDLIAIQNLRSREAERFLNLEAADGSIWDTVREPRHVFITETTKRRYSLDVGQIFPLLVGDTVIDFTVRGVLPSERAGSPIPSNLLVMDIGALARLLELEGRVSQVDLLFPEGANKENWTRKIQALLNESANARWEIRDPLIESTAGDRMTAAFRLNLTVLSLIALLVGAYLVTQALDAAVVRRRREISILHSLGLTKMELRFLWSLEIFIFGFIGCVLGILLGWGMAQFTVQAVSQTVNALYQSSSVEAASITWSDVRIGFGLGLAVSAIGGWLPLRDATATPPAQVLAAGNWSPGLKLLRRQLPGWMLIGLGCILSILPPLTLEGGSRFPLAGYLAALCWLVGGTLAATALFKPVSAILMRVSRFDAALLFGASRLRRATSRHRLAAAGLFVATAMAAAMAFLVGSFDRTVRNWLEVRFQADIYITSAGAQSADSLNRIRAETWMALANDDRVEAVDPFLSLPIEIDGIRTFLAGSDTRLIGDPQQFLWLGSSPPAHRLKERGAIPGNDGTRIFPAIANEAFTERFQKRVGSLVKIPLGGEIVRFEIVAIQADYGNEQGQLLIDRTVLVERTQIDAVTNLTFFLKEPDRVAEVIADWRLAYPGLSIRPNRELRDTALQIFRQTFTVTRALEILAVFIALVGLALALSSIIRESAQQLATLRSLGMRRSEIARVTATEALGIALVGVVGGLILSFALGALLIHVINKQSFGWTLQTGLPLRSWALLFLGVVATSGFTGWLIGYRTTARRQG